MYLKDKKNKIVLDSIYKKYLKDEKSLFIAKMNKL